MTTATATTTVRHYEVVDRDAYGVSVVYYTTRWMEHAQAAASRISSGSRPARIFAVYTDGGVRRVA